MCDKDGISITGEIRCHLHADCNWLMVLRLSLQFANTLSDRREPFQYQRVVTGDDQLR